MGMKLPASLHEMISLLFAQLLVAAQIVAVDPSPTAEIVRVPSPPAPPPIRSSAQNVLIQFVPESAKCSDGPLAVSEFFNSSVVFAPIRPATAPSEVDVTFRIDENGRPLGIVKSSAGQHFLWTSDVTPSIAASRFDRGKPRFGCTVRYAPRISEIADVSLSSVFEYSIFPNGGKPRAIFDRLKPEGSTCFNSPPAVLTRAYPDFAKIPATPGRPDWSMTQFDVNASGKPVNLRTVGGSGNDQLDKASRDAVARSQFAKGAKQGCLYPYWREAGIIAAPEIPDEDAFKAENASCPKKFVWATRNPAIYPDRFRKRNIEGWAIIVFDVAPWGNTGNVRIAAAEPSAEFGLAAEQVVKLRKVENRGEALTGCVEKVRFVMNPNLPEGTQDSIEN